MRTAGSAGCQRKMRRYGLQLVASAWVLLCGCSDAVATDGLGGATLQQGATPFRGLGFQQTPAGLPADSHSHSHAAVALAELAHAVTVSSHASVHTTTSDGSRGHAERAGGRRSKLIRRNEAPSDPLVQGPLAAGERRAALQAVDGKPLLAAEAPAAGPTVAQLRAAVQRAAVALEPAAAMLDALERADARTRSETAAAPRQLAQQAQAPLSATPAAPAARTATDAPASQISRSANTVATGAAPVVARAGNVSKPEMPPHAAVTQQPPPEKQPPPAADARATAAATSIKAADAAAETHGPNESTAASASTVAAPPAPITPAAVLRPEQPNLREPSQTAFNATSPPAAAPASATASLQSPAASGVVVGQPTDSPPKAADTAQVQVVPEEPSSAQLAAQAAGAASRASSAAGAASRAAAAAMAAAVAAANVSHSLQLQPLLLNGLLVKAQSSSAETAVAQTAPAAVAASVASAASKAGEPAVPVQLATLKLADEGFGGKWILLAALLAVVIAFCAVAARRSADRDSIRIRRASSMHAERRSISRTLSRIQTDGLAGQSDGTSDNGQLGVPGTPKGVARKSSYSERRRMSRMASEADVATGSSGLSPMSRSNSTSGRSGRASKQLMVPREAASAQNSESDRGDEVGRKSSYADRRRSRLARDGSTGGHGSDGGSRRGGGDSSGN
eukprot:TRINITY_DN49873_c0_g1_i1.p1 TRINITY_DN49873_c0_g1~~TRINITY_DN49873_c0_g1_i1.p1  ORF type:complete len:681 (-),score=145.27 TRINITY_DN49873_c0_g1_i1:136-2178(-)